jgi:hypothetical protein
MNRRILRAATIAVIACFPFTALAADIATSCQGAKQKEAAGLAKCLGGAEAKRILTADTAAYMDAVSKCTTKFQGKWDNAETKATDKGGVCPSTGDKAAVQNSIESHVACLTSALNNPDDAACLTCGNGVLETGEDCDLGDLGGGTCASATAGAFPTGALSCDVGCVFDTSECLPDACSGGAVVGGMCWFLGAVGESCTTVCSGKSRSYNSSTLTYAGSLGTDANCEAVLTALGIGGTGVVDAGPGAGIGCFHLPTAMPGRFREVTPATTAAASSVNERRACACQ